MTEENWIPLADYSNKHRVSISTLRRRIKADSIQFRFDSGKYYLLDQPIQNNHSSHRPSQLRVQQNWTPQPSMSEETVVETQQSNPDGHQDSLHDDSKEESRLLVDEPVLTTAQALLAEIKLAYRQILQEKEEQIFQLKDQMNDLRTLVKVLESENERLNNLIKPARSLDLDL